MSGRVLSKEEFVSRFLVARAKKARKPKGAAKPKPCRYKPPTIPVVRDDGVRFESVVDALVASGYAPGGGSAAKKRIDKGMTWRDGHVYEWA